MDDFFQSLLISGCLGALVGLERQWDGQFHNPERRIPAGVRTFTLWALIGTLCAHFSSTIHPFVFPGGLLGMMMFLSVFLFHRGREASQGTGFTTAAVAVLTFLMGGLVYLEHTKVAVILTVTVIILLAGKPYVHSVSKKFSKEDVRMALQFAAVSGIVLPLVPDRGFGPYEALNPRSIWLMVVIVSSVGFFGYLAVRIAGAKLGIAVTGLAGGLASSTATTLAMSRASKVQPQFSGDYSLAVTLACSVMFWRVLVLVGFFNIALAVKLWPYMLLLSLPGLGFAVWHFFLRKQTDKAEPQTGEYKNPLSLTVALQFAALYALIVFAVRAVGQNLGAAGIYVVSFFSGLTDLDAISLTLSQGTAAGTVKVDVAIVGVIIAGAANSVLKAGMASVLGSPELRRQVLLVLGTTVGFAVALVLYLIAGG